MKALLTIKNQPHYRREGFERGLKALGFSITSHFDQRNIHDLIIVWNRHGHSDLMARHYEKAGKPVIVVENGFVGTDNHGHHLFAMALDHHNGAGRWFVGDDDRWSKLNIPLKDWRLKGSDLLILPQRGIGPRGVAMPLNWERDILKRLDGQPRHKRVRAHPGNAHKSPQARKLTPLEDDLAGVYMAGVWASSAGIKAIINGTPVYHDFDKWIGASAACQDISQPFLGDRMPMLHRLSWAQWSIDEIATGEPIRMLLDLYEGKI